MPIFDVKRCRAWLRKERRNFGHKTLESLIRERSEVVAAAAPTPQCVKFAMLAGDEPLTEEVHDAEECGFCRNILRYYFILYATKREVQPYLRAVAQKNNITVAAVKRALNSSGFQGGKECLDTVDAVNFDALSPEHQAAHCMDCVRCSLRIDLWAVMNDIVLGGAA